MPSDKAAYLAQHYLTADTKPSTKKRKRKKNQEPGGLVIQDDDEWGFNDNKSKNNNGEDDDDPDLPVTIAGTSAEFRKAKKSAWKTVGAPIPTDTKDARDAAAAADAIIASAAAENAARAREADGEEDAPVIGNTGEQLPVAPASAMMTDGTHAGLQSGAAIAAQLERRQKEEREELERLKAERDREKKKRKKSSGGEEDEEEEEIVLRDATGRRVDISMRRAEARRAALEAERAEEARKLALKGEVQVEEARRRREALQDAALMPLARGKDDEEMNAELKATRRWNDPMQQFLAEEDVRTTDKSGKKRKGLKRPLYKGACPPNRYGIKPGYRWDGVDRGNGFEAERFKAINRRERNKDLSYAWQMDE